MFVPLVPPTQCARSSGTGHEAITFAVAPPRPRKFDNPPWRIGAHDQQAGALLPYVDQAKRGHGPGPTRFRRSSSSPRWPRCHAGQACAPGTACRRWSDSAPATTIVTFSAFGEKGQRIACGSRGLRAAVPGDDDRRHRPMTGMEAARSSRAVRTRRSAAWTVSGVMFSGSVPGRPSNSRLDSRPMATSSVALQAGAAECRAGKRCDQLAIGPLGFVGAPLDAGVEIGLEEWHRLQRDVGVAAPGLREMNRVHRGDRTGPAICAARRNMSAASGPPSEIARMDLYMARSPHRYR